MKYITLDGLWRLTGGGFDCTGTVPGSVCSFLLDAGLMEDPYYRDNELKTQALLENGIAPDSRYFTQPIGEDDVLISSGYAEKYRLRPGDGALRHAL